MQTFRLNCFGASAGDGNLALVVLDHEGGADARQALATAADVGATAFLARDAGGGWRIDYYYPHQRSPLCLHATLGAAQVLFELQGHAAPIALTTAWRGQQLQLLQAEGQCAIALQRQPVAAALPERAAAAALLGVTALAGAPALASVGSPKLLLEVRDSATLQALAPDLARIHAWSKETGISGCYAWCRRDDGNFEGRNFNHLDSRLEDRATGVAAGALALHLQSALTLYQGQGCCLHASVDGDTVWVGGRVERA